MSIIPQFPDPRYLSPEWTVIGRWEVPLSAVLNGKHGRRRGLFVYTVFYGTTPLYIGITRKTISTRLSGHLGATSNLGRCVKAAPIEMFTLIVLEIAGDLRIAERRCIDQLHPSLNIFERNRSRIAVERTINAITRDHKKKR